MTHKCPKCRQETEETFYYKSCVKILTKPPLFSMTRSNKPTDDIKCRTVYGRRPDKNHV